jgi:thiosulfate/3-mercaptopyruvate sulfurtransferase
VESGIVEVEKSRAELTPKPQAVEAFWEVAVEIGDPAAIHLDVRREDEYSGKGGYPCDPRQGHIPGAKSLDVSSLFAAPGVPKSPDEVRALVGGEDRYVVTYCHSGSRSGLALIPLRAAGYEARNYVGSWHEWSRHDELPIER